MTGKEHRSWHPAGTDRAEAERLAAKLAVKENSRTDAVRSLTFGAYLTSQSLPAKTLHLPGMQADAAHTYEHLAGTGNQVRTRHDPYRICGLVEERPRQTGFVHGVEIDRKVDL